MTPVLKLAADCPEIWKPTLAMGAPPVLLIVSPTGALATPTACAGKLNEIGFTLIWGSGKS